MDFFHVVFVLVVSLVGLHAWPSVQALSFLELGWGKLVGWTNFTEEKHKDLIYWTKTRIFFFSLYITRGLLQSRNLVLQPRD